MEIKTKFNMEDIIWFMDNNRPINAKVECITIGIDHWKTQIIYHVCLSTNSLDSQPRKVDELNAYHSKLDLIQSL